MALWAETVAPAMFPFLVLMPVITDEENRKLYARVFGKVMKSLFRLPPGAAACVIAGMISGTPAGAISARRGMKHEAFTVGQAYICLHLSTGVGPAFMICAVGQGMFSDAWIGVQILLCVWTAQVITGVVLSRLPLPQATCTLKHEPGPESGGAVRDGVMNVLCVCGWMVVISVFAGALPKALYAFFEISGGARYAAALQDRDFASALCAFGGGCIICQSLSVCRASEIGKCMLIASKLFSAAVAYALSCLFSRIPNISFSISADAFDAACVSALIMAFTAIAFAAYSVFKHKGSDHYGKS